MFAYSALLFYAASKKRITIVSVLTRVCLFIVRHMESLQRKEHVNLVRAARPHPIAVTSKAQSPLYRSTTLQQIILHFPVPFSFFVSS